MLQAVPEKISLDTIKFEAQNRRIFFYQINFSYIRHSSHRPSLEKIFWCRKNINDRNQLHEKIPQMRDFYLIVLYSLNPVNKFRLTLTELLF